MTWPQSDPIYVPAGAWIRARYLPGPSRRGLPRLEPRWDGAWHLATGDIVLYSTDHRSARTRCGHLVTASLNRRYDGVPIRDTVVADERPNVDLCSRCLRYSGDVRAAEFVAAARRPRPVVLIDD
jgi:hypothetical protein